MSGYAKIFRDLLDKPIFQNEKLLKVWIWCLLKAAHKEHEQLVGLQKIVLKKGEFIFGRKKAAAELNLSESTVWRFMKFLKDHRSLDIKTNNKYSVVTVVNWVFYQGSDENVDNKINNKWTTDGQQMDTNKNDKNVKNDKEYIPPIIPHGDVGVAEKSPKSDGAQRKKAGRTNRYEYTPEFEAFWAVYPRQADKVSGFAKFKECLKAGVSLEELLTAAKNYAGYVKKYNTEEPQILHAKTFLGPTKRYTEFVKGVGLFGQGRTNDQPVQGEAQRKPDWGNFYK